MLEIGAIYDGKVTGLTGFGAFVSLPDGKSGMVHISEVSTDYVKDIKEVIDIALLKEKVKNPINLTA